MPDPAIEAAIRLTRRGFRVVPVAKKSKRPISANWQELRLSEDDLPAHISGDSNIGVLLGEPSGWLVDVDLDCDEAVVLAGQYLPPTAAVTGRPSRPGSHRWYVCERATTMRHKDPTSGAMIVELRSTGAQTVVGPSLHPDGEPYDPLEGEPATVPSAMLAACVKALADAVVERRHGRKPIETSAANLLPAERPSSGDAVIRRAAAYLDAMPPAISGSGGHSQTYKAATAMVHGFGLDPDVAFSLLMDRYNPRCDPPWSEKELRHKVSDAATKPHDRPQGWLRDYQKAEDLRGVDLSAFMNDPSPAAASLSPCPVPVGDLVAAYPKLREPVIHGLLRAGETMNIIASPKTGKSWLTLDLAIAVATGRPWLGRYETEQGRVLIVDNELHRETSANRFPRVAQARGVSMHEIADHIFVDNLRGRLQDIFALAPYFESLEPGRYKVIVLDAFYRFMPAGMDENANADMASLYNHIDRYADRLGCCFVLIHHSTKGNQSGKSVTDVGAGAGAQSRATDTHLVLRPHEKDGVVVLDAAVRSWPPIDPTCLRWSFPVWNPADDLDPASLKNERTGKKHDAAPKADKPAEAAWGVERFVARFISAEPVGKAEIREDAKGEPGLSWRRVADLLEVAEASGLIYRWLVGRSHRVLFATVPQPAAGEEAGS